DGDYAVPHRRYGKPGDSGRRAGGVHGARERRQGGEPASEIYGSDRGNPHALHHVRVQRGRTFDHRAIPYWHDAGGSEDRPDRDGESPEGPDRGAAAPSGEPPGSIVGGVRGASAPRVYAGADGAYDWPRNV